VSPCVWMIVFVVLWSFAKLPDESLESYRDTKVEHPTYRGGPMRGPGLKPGAKETLPDHDTG